MMIGKTQGFHQMGTGTPQPLKKLFRSTDTGKSHQRLAPQRIRQQGYQMPPKQGLGGQGRWALPQQNHGIGLIQGIFLGHAQRSRRQNPIIPKPIRGIHHQKGQILHQGGVLQAIIQNQKV